MGLEALQAAQVVFCFVAYGSEVDTRPLLHSLLAGGGMLLVPKIIGRERMIAVPLHDWHDLEPGQLGILTPTANEEWTGKVDVCVTPGLGFTATGKRLGFGRGYYDQWFETHETGLRVGVAFDCQVVPELPCGEHDMPVDRIVTESKVIST
jgi:5-formyltetrahydrofolate cyclo-ligase